MLLETMIAIELEKEPFDYNQMKADAVVIEQDRRRFQFVNLDNPATDETLRRFYLWNALDMATTIYALENKDALKEGNILLGENPSTENLIIHKLILVPLFGHNLENAFVDVLTIGLQVATINNVRLILTTD